MIRLYPEKRAFSNLNRGILQLRRVEASGARRWALVGFGYIRLARGK
jgi:hypothetical protein